VGVKERVSHIQNVFPRDDLDFVAVVNRAAVDIHDAAELQRRLRETYPNVVVRIRGLHGDRTEMWYVYRDGTWTPTRRSWQGAGVLLTDAEGRYFDADPVALDLLGVSSVEQLRATPVTAFQPVPVDPNEEAAFRAAFAASAAQGLIGEGAIRRLDGELVRVRTAILPTGDGYRVLLDAIERKTTNIVPRVYAISDVLAEWQSAELRLVEVSPTSDEGRRLAGEVAFLRGQYQRMFRGPDAAE
jgi:PAS domain-containing protein